MSVSALDLRWIRGKTKDWGATIREVELIAAEIMVKEGIADIDWTLGYLRRSGQEPHQGDCSICRSWLTAPITCDACVYDEYMLKAWEQKKQACQPSKSVPSSAK